MIEVSQLPDGQWDAHIPGTIFGGTYTSRELAIEDAEKYLSEEHCEHYYVKRETIGENGYGYECANCGAQRPGWYLYRWEKH